MKNYSNEVLNLIKSEQGLKNKHSDIFKDVLWDVKKNRINTINFDSIIDTYQNAYNEFKSDHYRVWSKVYEVFFNIIQLNDKNLIDDLLDFKVKSKIEMTKYKTIFKNEKSLYNHLYKTYKDNFEVLLKADKSVEDKIKHLKSLLSDNESFRNKVINDALNSLIEKYQTIKERGKKLLCKLSTTQEDTCTTQEDTCTTQEDTCTTQEDAANNNRLSYIIERLSYLSDNELDKVIKFIENL